MLGALLSVLVLAVGLAMDAMAVSIARGLLVERVRAPHYAWVALTFGGMQAAMPLCGAVLSAWAGARFSVVEAVDHWIAFVLLAALSGKMALEALRGGDDDSDDDKVRDDAFRPRTMLLLGVATSIDALAAGVTLPLFSLPLGVSAALIGVVTAALSALGLSLSHHVGRLFGKRLDLVGAAALFAIGTKILVEHTLLAS